LFGRATAEEQDFLARLIVGELRQGALEGVMLEAVRGGGRAACGGGTAPASVAGGIAQVAEAALTGGATALERFSIRLMQPVLPMLAQPRRTSKRRWLRSARDPRMEARRRARAGA